MSDQIPRLSADKMPPALASFLAPRMKRLGYLGEFFQCTAHQPDALLSFLEFTEHLKHALPTNLTEVVALSVAVLMGSSYERVQHERLSRKIGFSEGWLREVLSIASDGPEVLSEEEWLVQRLVIEVSSSGGHHAGAEFEAVTRAIGPAQAIAVLMLISRYTAHAIIVNTLGLAPPVPALAQQETS
jgi:alkylhydroperoxidase family enzyme